MPELVLDNARIVTPDAVIDGHLVIRDGRIAAIGTGRAAGDDLGGDVVIPGLVELHTDHIETHLVPRPGVHWNPMAALQAHDAQLATAGITTVFDALRVGTDENSPEIGDQIAGMADVIARAEAAGRLRASHFIHVRCEVSAEDVLAGFALLADNPLMRIASLMDHAPGQRQFVDEVTYRYYYQNKMKLTDAEFELFRLSRIERSGRLSDTHRLALAAECRARGITMASHDDATEAHIDEAKALGVAIAEFPTTIAAARAAVRERLATVMGAPNVVRGKSHSGNVSALELFEAGLLTVLSSDYVPLSLMQAVFRLVETGAAELPAAVALVTKNPAAAAGLSDRGAIATGLRADLVRVRLEPGEPPVVAAVWREGVRVA